MARRYELNLSSRDENNILLIRVANYAWHGSELKVLMRISHMVPMSWLYPIGIEIIKSIKRVTWELKCHYNQQFYRRLLTIYRVLLRKISFKI